MLHKKNRAKKILPLKRECSVDAETAAGVAGGVLCRQL
jgi:hypothetical protein